MFGTRVSKKPITVPPGVQVRIADGIVHIEGPKGKIQHTLPQNVDVTFEDKVLQVVIASGAASAAPIAGTTRAILQNNVTGAKDGWSKKLQLVGVGYRVQVAKEHNRTVVNLTLGLSHPVSYIAPEGVEILSSAVTELEVLGIDRQLVGQVAADIRGICNGLRKPEPYKGKGIRYLGEKIKLKETKKK